MGRSLTRPFGLLQLPRDTSCILTAIQERDSPTGNGSGDVCHRTGNPRSAGIRRHGQACPGLDDQGQIYCGSTELRVVSRMTLPHSAMINYLPDLGVSGGTLSR